MFAKAASSQSTPSTNSVDAAALELAVQAMYERVAEQPDAEFHFETGRALAERLGYDHARLDAVPAPAVDSFAGVGHHFELAALWPGQHVVDLGSGSGMDAFVAATYVGPGGSVTGFDMTDAQRRKAERLRDESLGRFSQVRFIGGYIETLTLPSRSVDCVISNGVINLVADKHRVFDESGWASSTT